MDLKTYILNSPRGTASGLARTLSISRSYLSQIASGLAPISPERSVAIERATNGAVTRRDLRPDDFARIWPELAPPAESSAPTLPESVAVDAAEAVQERPEVA